MKNSRVWFLLFVSGILGAPRGFGSTAIVFQPVSSTGPHTIIGSDIFLPSGGQRVRMEIRVAGWGARRLRIAQVVLDSSGFDNGSSPIGHATVSCPGNNSTGHNFCAQTLEAGSRCAKNCTPGQTVGCLCETGFLNTTRNDYLVFGIANISAVDTSAPDYRFGMTTDFGEYVPDNGTVPYFGTFFLTVPSDAEGIYTIKFDVPVPPDPQETFLRDDSGQPIPIDLLTPARIIIGSPVPPGIRYAAFQPDQPGDLTAVRVTLTTLYQPGPPVAKGEDRSFGAFEGEVRWLGPPATFPDAAPGSTFKAAKLQCTPHFADWGAQGTIQIYGDAIMPSSVYTVHQVSIECQHNPDDPLCFGPAQVIHTGQWGDVVAPFARSDQPAQPDAADLAEVIDSYRHLLDATPKKLTQLRGATPSPASDVNFIDVDLTVDAIKGMPYPLPFPSACP